MTSRPIRIHKAEEALMRRKLTEDLIRHAADAVSREITPINDHRAIAKFRREISELLTRRAIKKAKKRTLA